MSSQLRNWLAGVSVVVLAILLPVLYLNTRVTVTLHADGETRPVRTHATTVAGAVQDAHVTLYPEDVLVPPAKAALTPGQEIWVKRAFVVRVEVDGQVRLARTQLTSPPAILTALGVALQPEDELWADGVRFMPDQGLPALAAPQTLMVRRALSISISDNGGQAVPVHTAARTVGEALWNAGFQLYRADQVTPALDTPLTGTVQVSVSRSRPVTLLVDGQTLRIRTHSATVGDLLAEAGLALVGEDYTVPPMDQPVPAGASAADEQTVRVVRVRTAQTTESQTIAFDSAYQAMADWEIDTVGQVQAGVAGVKQRRTRVRFEDGREVSRTVEAEYVAVPPTTRIIGYGTKIVIRTLDTPDGPIEYWRAYAMYATSYAAKFLGGSNRTAAGMTLTKGIAAIDRRYIPFYTRMYVPGYGPAVAGDTGGGVRGRWIDLGFDDWNYEGWHKQVMVYFLTPVPPANQITWIIPSTIP
jgi:resuscitation-promoting factor RpfB